MNLRILVVDDSSAMRAYVRAALEEDAGFSVEVEDATSGFEALRLLPRERFDLVIVDINMPNINGLELISFIRKSRQHHDTPVLVISTEGSDRDRERGLSLGAAAYLCKPFSSEALVQTVRRICGGRPGVEG